MRYFFVQDRQLVGTTDDPEIDLPGLAIVEGPNLPIEQLYWDGSAVALKPDRPSEFHYWNGTEWVLPVLSAIPKSKDWDGLLRVLRGTSLFEKCYAASERTLKANSAFTLLLAVLTSTRNSIALEDAIAKMRDALSGISEIGDFTPEELEQIDQILEDCGFSLRVSETTQSTQD